MSVHLQNQDIIIKAFSKAGKDAKKYIRREFRAIAQPVAEDAERLAFSEIRRMSHSPRWARMRVGVTQSSVYVVPAERGTKVASRRRKNFAPLMMNRAMAPALEQNQAEIIEGVERALEHIARDWGTA